MVYYFKNINTLRELICNIIQCTKINGYFMGTCFDGTLLNNKLLLYDSIQINDITGQKILEIQKLYPDDLLFNDDDSCVGFKINLRQESIHQYVKEYLVNFNYLIKI